MNIGDRLKALRGGLSQDEFSQRIGFHKNTIGNYERGERTPDVDFLRAVCEKLDISSEWLLWGKGSMHRGEVTPATAPTQEAPPAEDDFKISDMLTKTAEVLESDTIYRTALASNINAFHQAVNSERTLARLEERMVALEAKVEGLVNENDKLKRRVEQQAKNLDGYNVSEDNAQTYDKVAEDPDSYNGTKKTG